MSLNQILIMTRARQKTSNKVTFVEKHIPTDGKKDGKSSNLYCVLCMILIWLYNRNHIRELKTAVLPHTRTLREATNQTPPLSRQLSTMGLIKISDPAQTVFSKMAAISKDVQKILQDV